MHEAGRTTLRSSRVCREWGVKGADGEPCCEPDFLTDTTAVHSVTTGKEGQLSPLWHVRNRGVRSCVCAGTGSRVCVPAHPTLLVSTPQARVPGVVTMGHLRLRPGPPRFQQHVEEAWCLGPELASCSFSCQFHSPYESHRGLDTVLAVSPGDPA